MRDDQRRRLRAEREAIRHELLPPTRAIANVGATSRTLSRQPPHRPRGRHSGSANIIRNQNVIRHVAEDTLARFAVNYPTTPPPSHLTDSS